LTALPRRIRTDLLIVGATELELEWSASTKVRDLKARGRLNLEFLVTGVGEVSAAFALGSYLNDYAPALILSVGVGGAFPSAGLAPGGVAVATSELDEDWGVESSRGEVKGPLVVPRFISPSGEAVQGEFPVSTPHADIIASLSEERYPTLKGPFLTTSTVTSTAERAEALYRAHGAIVENMEGAAVAHAALISGAEFAEVRGISNLVGPRDLSSWKLDEAAQAAGWVATRFIEYLEESK